MKSLIEKALGEDWHKLPQALQVHYKFGESIDDGAMDIEYPRFMQPLLSFLHLFGVLVNQRGKKVPTIVNKKVVGNRQYWERTIRYPNGKTINFNSFWVSAGSNQIIEFVNPYLGLQMSAYVDGEYLKYHGVNYILKIGGIKLPIPEWLLLGHTTIVEEALDERHIAMDFRLTHPLLGQIFRYAGKFEVS